MPSTSGSNTRIASASLKPQRDNISRLMLTSAVTPPEAITRRGVIKPLQRGRDFEMACAYSVDQAARGADGARAPFDAEKARTNFSDGRLRALKGLERMARPCGKPEPGQGLKYLARHRAAHVQDDCAAKVFGRAFDDLYGVFDTVVGRRDQDDVCRQQPRAPRALRISLAYETDCRIEQTFESGTRLRLFHIRLLWPAGPASAPPGPRL